MGSSNSSLVSDAAAAINSNLASGGGSNIASSGGGLVSSAVSGLFSGATSGGGSNIASSSGGLVSDAVSGINSNLASGGGSNIASSGGGFFSGIAAFAEAEKQRLAAIEAEKQRVAEEAAVAERQRLAAAEAERKRVAEEAERQRIAAAANKEANDTLNSILKAYIDEKANKITTAIENEIANSNQTATTFGVVSSYNDMKTAFTSWKTTYDNIIRSIQTYLAIADKVAALNEYNKAKDTLIQTMNTAINKYYIAKSNFNSALITAQNAARATEWMGTNRPGCRNLVSNSASLNSNSNIQCNDNEYIYGFKSTDNTYFYTCCATPKGIVGTGGLPGFEGPIGPQGAQGPQGARGQQGPQQYQQGPQGPQGEQGLKGEDIRGPNGPPGKKGKQGAPGPRGSSVELGKNVIIKQIAGPSGLKGTVGPRGPQGARGQQGQQGTMGKKGKDGKDADEDNVEYVSSPFNRDTLRILDISNRIENMLSSKV